jgi:GT2 family glycosyltransferase
MAKNKPVEISVSVVSWNCRSELVECVQSLYAQVDAPAFEVIVIDNDSSDDTVEYMARHFPDITFITNPRNVGFGRAHNQSLELAAGHWFFILNPDTILPPDTLRKLYAERNTSAMLAPRLLHGGGELQRSAHRKWPSVWSHFYLYNFFVFVIAQRLVSGYDPTLYSHKAHYSRLHPLHVMGAAMFIKASSFRRLRGFDSDFFLYLEETDLCYRLLQSGEGIVYLPEVAITHQLGASSKPGAIGQGSPHYMKSVYLYYSKRHGVAMTRVLKWATSSMLAVNLLLLRGLHFVWPSQPKILLGVEFTKKALVWHREHRGAPQ